MARYNSSLASATITGATTISTPNSGAFTNLTGTPPYTVTLPAPSLFPGSNQTFYNTTNGTITLSTPSGTFSGTGGSGTGTVSVFASNVVSVTSDGTNYIVISEDGSAMAATTGSFTSNVTIGGTLTVQAGGGVTLAPGATGTIDNVSIGSSARATGAFTTLAANGQVSFTSNTASSSTSTGTLVVTGGLGVSGAINATSITANLTGTIQTAAQPNITSVGTLTSLTSSGDITVSDTTKGYKWGGSYAISPQGNHIPQATGFLSLTGGVTFSAGWYRIARSAIQTGGNGLRGGAKITVGSTGNYLGPLQDVIYLFKDWTTSGQIGRVENYIGSYFSRYRLAMDSNYAYLEGFIGGLSVIGTSGWQVTAEPYSGNWNADNWTVANETLTPGLASPTAQYIIPVFSGGTTLRRLLLDRENEGSGASSPSLEIRVNGGITTGNYDGIFFTQSVDGSTPLGSFRLANKNSGAPDFELWTRSGSSETQRFIFSNAGKLGIGVNPSSQLHVVSSGTDSTLSVANTTTTGYAFGISKLGETYSTSGTSVVTPYEVAGTLGNFVASPNSVNTGAILTFNAYNSSNGATGAYVGAAAGPTGNGPANFVIGRRTGTSSFAESLRIDTSGNTRMYGYTTTTGTVNTSTIAANSASGNTIGSYTLGNGRWWNTGSGAVYLHFLLPARYNQNNSLMWCLEIKGYDFIRPGIINIMIGGYVTPPSNGGPMSRVAAWDATSYYSPTAYYSTNYARGIARIYMPEKYYNSFTVNSIASGNGDVIQPDELQIIESASATI